MPHYTEQNFEAHIEAHLLHSHYHKIAPTDYDKELCLIPAEVLRFIQISQAKEYEKLQVQYGEYTDTKLCQRLSKEITKKGTLHVLRKGLADRGSKFRLAYFKPSSGMNPDHQTLYQCNRFSVIRQLKYSTNNENSLDLGIFLNGLPILTMELKNSLTGQTAENAIKQYKNDRDPKERLFVFKRCLVHFAVGNEKVFMTTRLSGAKTRFLPFNRDTENPVNPQGHKTSYLWEDILQPDTLLDLINHYLHLQTSTNKVYDQEKGLIEKESSAMIFPRFHQLDVVRKLLKQVKEKGVGQNYLIQHSAGSGKSNSIAWLVLQLAALYPHEQATRRLFDSIIVITDRKVLDRQLQNTIKQFEQTSGVVCPIDQNAQQLKEAIQAGKDIIITTIQKFSVISDAIASSREKQFAVIVDEAHSSQSGESAKHLKKTLSVAGETVQESKTPYQNPLSANPLQKAEAEETIDFDLEDALLREIEAKGQQNHISYFAFTATPKNKTLELFGRKIDPNAPPEAFHYYTMKQAIEEGFILDVLNNYTTYKRYFKLLKKLEEDKEYDKSKVMRLLTAYVDLQPYAIESKVRIMLDHFLDKTVNAIQGRGRAMVVTRSRLHAVKYFLMFKKVMKEKHLTYKPLVAFSGTVHDPDTKEDHTETSLGGVPSNRITDAFKTPEYRILIVANKFQTGFDEPLLHTLYVDKELGGVQAVQTLSRLNRTLGNHKSETLVLDFVNEAATIETAFQPYYQKIFLEEESDPNKLHDLQGELEAFGIYTEANLKEFAEIFLNPHADLEHLQPILDQCVTVWNEKTEEEREDFRVKLQSYVRLYGFLSQIITFESIDLESLYIFAKALHRKLPKRTGELPTEVLDAVDLDSFRIQKTFEASIALETEDGAVTGISTEATGGQASEKDFLSAIIEKLNEIHGIDLTEDDKIDLERIREQMNAHEELRNVMRADNTFANKKKKFDEVLDGMFLDFVNTKLQLYEKLSQPEANQMLKQSWFAQFDQAMQESQISI